MDVDAPLYQPLDSGKHEIRVLRIEPSRASEPDGVTIHCSLETISLNSKVVYQALSYEWGAPDIGTASGRVLVNSHEVTSTPNLRLALQRLSAGGAYWIDALCIDQSDDKERGHQVRLMTEIYRHASGILVWLGSEEGNSSMGMRFLNEVGAFLVENESASNASEKFPGWLRETISNTAHQVHWDGLRQIFQRSYWSRLWVIQELVVTPNPKEVKLLCGSSEARFSDLCMVIQQLTIFRDEVPFIQDSGTLDATINDLEFAGQGIRDVAIHVKAWGRERRDEFEIGISSLMSRYWERLCADPRDRVYALLGVSLSYPGEELPITYTIPVLDVYKNLVKYVVAGSGRTDILTEAGHDQGVRPTHPSWVPDWQQYDRHRCLIRITRNASGELPSIVRYSADDNDLITQGFVLGTITSLLGTNRPNLHTYDEAIGAGRRELSRWLPFIESTLHPTSSPTTGASASAVRACYEILFYISCFRKEAEEHLPFHKFDRLCDQLSLSDAEYATIKDLSHMNISNFLYLVRCMRHRRQLCSIDLVSPENVPSVDGTPARASTAIGLCSLNARVDDVVSVVRGCRHPLLLRRVGERFELVGEMYVHGFMDGEAVERFPEVEIELI